jgi:hypothetical protein
VVRLCAAGPGTAFGGTPLLGGGARDRTRGRGTFGGSLDGASQLQHLFGIELPVQPFRERADIEWAELDPLHLFNGMAGCKQRAAL